MSIQNHVSVENSGKNINTVFLLKKAPYLELRWAHRWPQTMFSSRNKKNIDTFWLKLSRAMGGGTNIRFLLFLHENIRCGYSSEAPWRGASNENLQHMFSLRNKKISIIFS